MPAKVINIPEIGKVHLYKRRGAKYMRLSLGDNGKIRVTMPHWIPYDAAINFTESKKDWIYEHLSSPSTIKHGALIGKAHRMSYLAENTRNTIATRVTGSEIRIHHPAEVFSDHTSVQAAAQKASIRALKIQSEKLLPLRVSELAGKHGFDYQSVSIKQLTSRWGSCSSNQEIALSCFLIQLPWHLIDYVILHELLHTKIMAHGPKFWGELEKLHPASPLHRKEIKTFRPVIITE